VTLTVFVPAVRVQVAATVVEVNAPTVQVLPVPDTVTAVAPSRFVPASVSTIPVPAGAGLGATEVRVGPSTVNVCALVVPPGVLTVTFLAVIAAVAVIVKVAVIVVALTTASPLTVTPVPDTATVVPVAVKFVPVSFTGTTVPRTPVFGETDVSVGTGGATTVNVVVLVVPIGVVTLTFLVVSPAVAVIVNVAVTVESFTTVRPLELTPLPDTLIAVAAVKPLPVNVTGKLVVCSPVSGEIEVKVAPSTVNVTVPLAPPAVVTLTVLVVSPAVSDISNVVVIVVELTTIVVPTVTPDPDTVTVVPVVVKLVPVSVTGTFVPRRPLAGVIEVNVGAAGLTTVRTKCCTAFEPTPLLAVKVRL
jgi:hypothetical protein